MLNASLINTIKGDIMEEKEFSEMDNLEETEVAVKKTNDFWARHNIGTRITMVVFILSYVGSLLSTIWVETPQWLIDTTGWLLFSAFVTITLGINGLSKIAEIITAMKTK